MCYAVILKKSTLFFVLNVLFYADSEPCEICRRAPVSDVSCVFQDRTTIVQCVLTMFEQFSKSVWSFEKSQIQIINRIDELRPESFFVFVIYRRFQMYKRYAKPADEAFPDTEFDCTLRFPGQLHAPVNPNPTRTGTYARGYRCRRSCKALSVRPAEVFG